MRVLAVGALLLATPLVLFATAQSPGVVAGVVTDAQTGAPLSGVAVRIIGGAVVTFTRANGNYRLQLSPGQHQLQARSIGFVALEHSVLVTANQTATRDFALQPSAVTIDEVVTLGTRRSDRTGTQSPVPVDVISASMMQSTGFVETWQILQRLVPSVNFPHVPLADDHMRSITLRGLAPDQVLVLVNGKRRHSAAVVQSGPVLNGSSPVDINTIPLSAIERIEVLRDGAAAQYGSDAIAGVVNIVLKAGEQREARTSVGQVFSSEGGRTFRDGDVLTVSTTQGATLAHGGYVTVTTEWRDREGTNRAYPDARKPQYLAGDPRNDLPPRISSSEGDGAARDLALLLHAGIAPAAGITFYGFGGLSQRNGTSATASFRRPNDVRTVRALHPDGFLAEIGSRISDYSGVVGARGDVAGWHWDIASSLGNNVVRYTVANSNNVSLGTASPTTFYAGRLASRQWTNTLDVRRPVQIGLRAPLNVALGVEFRRDRYQLQAGEPDAWRDGGVPIIDGDSAGRPAAVGSQGFLGFRPIDEANATRHNIAAYVDLETQLTSTLLVGVAGRGERYSDHGSTTDGKIAARFEPFRGLAVRGAAGTGFRAPSLSQSYFSTTRGTRRNVNGVSTSFIIRTLPVHTPEAQLLGAQPLRPETSMNLSAGLVMDLPRAPTVTIDYFVVRVDDRVVQSGEFVAPAIAQLFEQHGLRGVAGGRFFTNAIDTKTRGLDIVSNYGIVLGRTGFLRLTGGYNQSRTRITRIAPAPPQLSAYQSVLFNRVERGKMEHGQPSRTLALTANYTGKRFGVNLHNQRFGETALLDATDPAGDQIVRARWITDVGVSYQLHQRLRVGTSASNLFDVYPDEWIDFSQGVNAAGMSVAGIFRYPGGISPFGMNGRTILFSLSYR